MIKNINFAGFIITYERHEILLDTINKVFDQTYAPEKILIVDNSETEHTKNLIEGLKDPKIEYYRVGYNSGPAGGAYFGLKILSEQGYQWIYWGDDDDPPYFPDVFEKLLKIASENPITGCVGAVGQFFDNKNGLLRRVSNEMLNGEGILEVNNIAGGMIKIVNSEIVVKHSVLPNASLFYGFEELEYDLQIQNVGYSLLVDKELFYRHRLFHNRVQLKKSVVKKTEKQLARDYYSTRNMLFILKGNKLFSALCFTFLRINYKCVVAFQYGFRYGIMNFIYQVKAVLHFVFSKYGKTL